VGHQSDHLAAVILENQARPTSQNNGILIRPCSGTICNIARPVQI